jgi:hypothetical protein
MWRLPYLVLILLNLGDFATTTLLIQRRGFTEETNPFLYHWMVAADSIYPMFVAKAIPVALLGIVMLYFRSRLLHREKLIRNTMWGLNIGLSICIILAIMMLIKI